MSRHVYIKNGEYCKGIFALEKQILARGLVLLTYRMPNERCKSPHRGPCIKQMTNLSSPSSIIKLIEGMGKAKIDS
jgi:hypothetical protein